MRRATRYRDYRVSSHFGPDNNNAISRLGSRGEAIWVSDERAYITAEAVVRFNRERARGLLAQIHFPRESREAYIRAEQGGGEVGIISGFRNLFRNCGYAQVALKYCI